MLVLYDGLLAASSARAHVNARQLFQGSGDEVPPQDEVPEIPGWLVVQAVQDSYASL